MCSSIYHSMKLVRMRLLCCWAQWFCWQNTDCGGEGSWKHSSKAIISGNIWVYLGISGNIWVYLGISGYMWVYLGISGYIWVNRRTLERKALFTLFSLDFRGSNKATHSCYLSLTSGTLNQAPPDLSYRCHQNVFAV
jgi:hypothetical protein